MRYLLIISLFFTFSARASLFVEPYGTWESSSYELEEPVGGKTAEWSFTGTSFGGRAGFYYGGFFFGVDGEYGKRIATVVTDGIGLTETKGQIFNYSLLVGYDLPQSPVRLYGKAISTRFKDDTTGNMTGAGWSGGLALGVHQYFNLIIEYRKLLYVEVEDVPLTNRVIIEGFTFGVSMPIFM